MAHRVDVFTKDASFTKIFRKLGRHGDGGTHFDPINHFNVSGESDPEARSAARVNGKYWT